MKIEELKTICDTVVDLIKLRQKECKHLCIENLAPGLFGKMISEFKDGKELHHCELKCFASPCPCTAVKMNQCNDWCRFYPPKGPVVSTMSDCTCKNGYPQFSGGCPVHGVRY